MGAKLCDSIFNCSRPVFSSQYVAVPLSPTLRSFLSPSLCKFNDPLPSCLFSYASSFLSLPPSRAAEVGEVAQVWKGREGGAAASATNRGVMSEVVARRRILVSGMRAALPHPQVRPAVEAGGHEMKAKAGH